MISFKYVIAVNVLCWVTILHLLIIVLHTHDESISKARHRQMSPSLPNHFIETLNSRMAFLLVLWHGSRLVMLWACSGNLSCKERSLWFQLELWYSLVCVRVPFWVCRRCLHHRGPRQHTKYMKLEIWSHVFLKQALKMLRVQLVCSDSWCYALKKLLSSFGFFASAFFFQFQSFTYYQVGSEHWRDPWPGLFDLSS